MANIERIHSAPVNLDRFVAEIAPSIQRVFGTDAGQHYRQHAYRALTATIEGGAIECWCARDVEGAGALLFLVKSGGRGTVSFLHGLARPSARRDVHALLETVLDREQTRALATDYIPFDAVDAGSVYIRHGFRRTDRQIMVLEKSMAYESAPAHSGIRRVRTAELPDLSRVLMETYAAHPERFLFPETHSTKAALTFLARTWSGAHGAKTDQHTYGIWRHGRCQGFALGTELYPGVGFILHIAVTPDAQGQGLGGALARHLCGAFFSAGLDRVLLGVTSANRAANLYARLGFRASQHFSVFHNRASQG